jgi:hypothetical protein
MYECVCNGEMITHIMVYVYLFGVRILLYVRYANRC